MAILNPNYEGKERVRLSHLGDEEALEYWRFSIRGKAIEIAYIWQSFDFYWHRVGQLFQQFFAFEVG